MLFDHVFSIFSGFDLALAQPPIPARPSSIENGEMEEWNQPNSPTGWRFASTSGGTIAADEKSPFAGDRSAKIDATHPNPNASQLFSNLMTTIDGNSWQGKRIRFRAAVKTADLVGDGRAQLWFRVDRKSVDGKPVVGAFDNMDSRPIKSKDWKVYEIVLDVEEDAEQLVLGAFLIGKGIVWIDSLKLEEVDQSAATTAFKPARPAKSAASPRGGIPPALMKAFKEAGDAPQQPFFNHWLWLVLIALILFGLTAISPKRIGSNESAQVESGVEEFAKFSNGDVAASSYLGSIPKFAIRFSFVYWIAYSFPSPFEKISFGFGTQLAMSYRRMIEWISNVVAKSLFSIEEPLVPSIGNGSGDTTAAYIHILICFVFALLLASIWSMVDWRKTDYRITKDLLRSYLRYVLAFAMIGYGLAKVSWDFNQFPSPSSGQLQKTWGNSSPMNVLWTFMGASRSYTVFAGMGEVVGGLLLAWRRTTTLGAMVVLGVMLNVVMLNFCYDIPVKIYSVHLLGMAMFLLIPMSGRLLKVLLLNRPTAPICFHPPYTNKVTIIFQRIIKAAIILIGVLIPIVFHSIRQANHFGQELNQPEYIGLFEVINQQRNSVEVADERAIKTIKFERLPFNEKGERIQTDWLTVSTSKGGMLRLSFEIDKLSEKGTYSLQIQDHQSTLFPTGSVRLALVEEDVFEIEGKIADSKLSVRFKRNDEPFLLTRRGFRWINEVPFNR